MNKLYAACSPGLEPFLALELRGLDLQPEAGENIFPGSVQPGALDEDIGGVEFEGGMETLYRANLWLRTASRIIVRLGGFHATAFSELRKKAGRLEWERFLTPGQPVAIRVTCKKSRLYHSDAVAERIAGAIGDRLGKLPVLEKFDDKNENVLPQLVVVRLLNDQCLISIDSSGGLLHRRGYRLATAKAPLRENLAAGLLLASDWDLCSALIDPFCGSGSIPIEAALLAAGWAPGRSRRFAFMDWPDYQATLWEGLLQKSQPALAGSFPSILASDRDAGAIKLAQENAARAGVLDVIQFSCRAVSGVDPPGIGWLVTNPPYGVRVSSGKDLRNLYAQLGNVIRKRLPGWRIAILCNEMQLLKQTGLPLETSLAFVNGGIPVSLGRGQAPEVKELS